MTDPLEAMASEPLAGGYPGAGVFGTGSLGPSAYGPAPSGPSVWQSAGPGLGAAGAQPGSGTFGGPMAPTSGTFGGPSVWQSAGPGLGAPPAPTSGTFGGPSVWQSAAPGMAGDPVAPTSGTFAGVPSAAAAPNPFATAPPATSPYEPLLPSTGAGLGSVPATGASASPEERPAVAVGLKISRLLDMPKTAPEHGQYVVKVISADGGVDELPAVTAVPGVGDSVEDVDMSKSANLSIMTSAVKVTVQVLRGGGWLGGGSLVGEAVIHRFDPRSKTNCAYVLTNPEPE